jgi:hypothetical protein
MCMKPVDVRSGTDTSSGWWYEGTCVEGSARPYWHVYLQEKVRRPHCIETNTLLKSLTYAQT